MIKTKDFPQADRLNLVANVALAIAKGLHTDKEIEGFIGLESGNRQGRYYRKAAEILDLTFRPRNNFSELTFLGHTYVNLETEKEKKELLKDCIFRNQLFRKIIAFINNKKPSKEELKVYFISLYPKKSNTPFRRFNTAVSWLEDAKIIKLEGEKFKLYKTAKNKYVVRKQIFEGLKGKQLSPEIVESFLGTDELINFQVQKIKTEKANFVHKNLISSVTNLLIQKELKAEDNSFIDLYSSTDDEQVQIIFEMKSITETNFLSQIRGAISQLYEYRFRFGVPSAILCIVTNKPIPEKTKWVRKYLEKDRKIAYMWTEDFFTLKASPSSKKLLQNFSPLN